MRELFEKHNLKEYENNIASIFVRGDSFFSVFSSWEVEAKFLK